MRAFTKMAKKSPRCGVTNGDANSDRLCVPGARLGVEARRYRRHTQNKTGGPRPGVLMTPQMCSPGSGRKRWEIKGLAPSEALGKGPSCGFQLLGALCVPWLVATWL